MRGNILIVENAESGAQEAAERFACAAVKAVARHGRFAVAVPGGSSPKGMFELLASRSFDGLIPWSATHIFFTDERIVPPDHEDSNYKLANDLLFSRVPIPEVNIHRFRTELSPDDAAADYERTLHEGLGDDMSLDLVILGMGADAHTASLFPGSQALNEQTKAAAANYVKKLDTYRLTLTIPILNSAGEIIILIFGADKAEALLVALKDESDINQHPVQAIHTTHGRLLWLVDKEAASRLCNS